VPVIAIPLAFRRAAVAGTWFSQSCSKSVDRGREIVQRGSQPGLLPAGVWREAS
jgi:hypothetical protein